MATVVPGPLLVDIRGSVGDVVFGRNPGGIFARNRTSPSQPASAERDLRQAAITAISQYWSASLTQAARDDWNKYGRQHLLPDRWGRPGARPGFLHFVRCNVQHYRITSAITVPNAPVQPPPWIPAFTFTADDSANNFVIDLPPTNYPDIETGTFLYAYAGRDLNPGRVFYNGPWRYIGWNMKTGPGYIWSPWTLAYPWTLTAGDNVYCRLVMRTGPAGTGFGGQAITVVVA